MTSTVSVACKLPGGLILRLYDFHEVEEPGLGGSKTVRRARRRPLPDVILKGFASSPAIALPKFIVGGYGITHNIDAAFFNEWMKQNAESDLVKNHIIFAHEKAEAIEAKVKEHRDTLSGFEPLNPETVFKAGVEVPVDARWPHRVRAGERGGMTI